MVSSRTKTVENVDIPRVLITDNHEEADTLIILHAKDSHRDSKLSVFSPDADVSLRLVQFFLESNKSLGIRTSKRNLKYPRFTAAIKIITCISCINMSR